MGLTLSPGPLTYPALVPLAPSPGLPTRPVSALLGRAALLGPSWLQAVATWPLPVLLLSHC